MTIRRIALVYDDRARPETTGVYCRRALESLVEAVHFQPDELAGESARGFDLYLNIDDGLRYHLPDELRPQAWWAIDTHVNFDWCVEKGRRFDVLFAAQRAGAERLRREGLGAEYLPLGCDPAVHRKHDVTKQYDVAFVGNVFPGPRAELLELIQSRYPASFVGQAYFEEMARTYSGARMAFNRSILGDVNMRVFEATACGSMLLTNDLRDNGQAELFQDGVHLATYDAPEELLEKLAYYLERTEIRERIAAAGMAEAVEKHTYRHRMERLLGDVEKVVGRVAANVPLVQEKATAIGRGGLSSKEIGGLTRHDSVYYGYARPEVLELIPLTARRVLDLGCGVGRLGEALRRRQPAEVVGVELDPAAAALARERLDRVVGGDIEQVEPGFSPGSFDAIVCGDILEHLRDPDRLLRRARSWLAADGRLIASIPNARHHSVVRSLLEGNWTYESAGLLDRTHLRFFTRREVEKLFYRAGFAIDDLRWVGSPGDDLQTGGPGEVRVGRLQLVGLSNADVDEFRAYQYLVVARPEPAIDHGLTSIVLVTHNQLEYTRRCLDSLWHRTDEPYELIVVDNGSTDGTVESLRDLPDVKLIVNEANRGFPIAANQGIRAAAGAQIVLLNNDTIVTTGWLGRLLGALDDDPRIGLVGPCSNYVSGAQRVETSYESLADLDGFAWDWGRSHDGQRSPVNRLVGFCLLIRREVVDAIGFLDEQFEIGCFDDDDYCLRAIQKGFQVVIAWDAFVHHFGGRTFIGLDDDFAEIMKRNGERFRAKWRAVGDARSGGGEAAADALDSSGDSADSSPLRLVALAAPGGGLLLGYERPRLSLCMIVRDSARTLAACLESVRPWVDEMVIVDTGSVDDTPRLVESFGGRLFHFPWCDDFSAARNESLRHARGEWLFWMDSDDTIPRECGRQLRGLIERAVPANLLGYVIQVYCPGGGEDGDAESDMTAVDHVKLFRNRPDLRFDGRIHEQILPSIRRAGGEVAWTELYVVHSGSDQSRAAQEGKLRRDLRLLELELMERPEHPFTLFNLGMTHVHAGRFAEAADYLRRGIARSAAEESHLRKAFALLVYAEMRLGRHEAAIEACRRGQAMFPRDAELRFREGVLLHELGQLEEAKRCYLDVLETQEERYFASVDRGLAGIKARRNLAVIAAEVGDLPEAEGEWRRVVAESPRYRPGWRGIGETLVHRGLLNEAWSMAARLVDDAHLRVEGLLLRSRVALAQGQVATAIEEMDRAQAEYPGDPEILSRHCQLLFEHGPVGEAERALRRLIEGHPTDASAYHNLGTLFLQSGRYDDAERAFRQSLRYRLNCPGTYLNLGYALKESGRLSEAVAAWEQVLRLAPGESRALNELRQVAPPVGAANEPPFAALSPRIANH